MKYISNQKHEWSRRALLKRVSSRNPHMKCTLIIMADPRDAFHERRFPTKEKLKTPATSVANSTGLTERRQAEREADFAYYSMRIHPQSSRGISEKSHLSRGNGHNQCVFKMLNTAMIRRLFTQIFSKY